MDNYSKALLHYIGFYKFDDPLWRQYLPLVFMFFFSIIVEKYFKTKIKMENDSTTVDSI